MDHKGITCLQVWRRPLDEGSNCNGDPHLSIGSGRSSQEHEVRQSSGIRQHPPRIPEKSGTKSEEMASNISNANYFGKEPPQELENYKNSRHPYTRKISDKASTYRHISFLSIERTILHRISPAVGLYEILNIEQAGFSTGPNLF